MLQPVLNWHNHTCRPVSSKFRLHCFHFSQDVKWSTPSPYVETTYKFHQIPRYFWHRADWCLVTRSLQSWSQMASSQGSKALVDLSSQLGHHSNIVPRSSHHKLPVRSCRSTWTWPLSPWRAKMLPCKAVIHWKPLHQHTWSKVWPGLTSNRTHQRITKNMESRTNKSS